MSTGNGRTQLRFTDGGYTALQPGTTYAIEDYRFEGTTDGAETAQLNLVEGSIRIVTGLIGRVNKQIVNGLNKLGSSSIGLSGVDGNLIEARQLGDGSHGLVGEVTKVNTDVIEPLLAKGYIPVISSVAASSNGSSFNINADTVAGAISSSLNAKRMLMLTDVPGVLDKNGKLIKELSSEEAKKLIDQKVITSGMIPKVETCIETVENGTDAAVILDGRAPHATLMELFTEHGGGTLIRE